MLKLHQAFFACASLFLFCSTVTAQNMTINIIPDAGLSANPAALAAFQRAADSWALRFSDPITVNINAGLANLGGSVIGSTNPSLVQGSYNLIRNAMVADGASDLNGAILNFLPTAAQFSAVVSAGKTLSGNIVLTTANAKALGFTIIGTPDATITFNSTFSFDFDRSNGVSPGLTDFETVAVHEIGHALGFTSVVDNLTPSSLSMMPLDLFRFQNNVANRDPSTNAEFTSFPRYYVQGGDAITDDLTNEYRMSTGTVTGDGRQASHWKDDDLTLLPYIGVMDPTLGPGVIELITDADLRAFDLIGYNFVAIPEPSTIALGATAVLLGAYGWCRHRRALQKQADMPLHGRRA